MPDDSKNPKASVPTLLKSLSVVDGIMVLIGITIGAGIYSTPQIIAEYQTNFTNIILLWILVGVFIYIGGFIYAELGSRFPETGGEYIYLTKAFGPTVGFLFGWAQLFIIRTSPAAGLAIITVNYLEHFVVLSDFTHTSLSILIIILIGVLNYRGIKQASIYQNISSVIKIGGLFTMVAIGLLVLQGNSELLKRSAELAIPVEPMTGFAAAMMLIVFSYLGFDRVGYSAGEMKNPRKTIALSMFIGLATVILIYVLVIFLYHYTLGMEGVRSNKQVASVAATELFGPVGAALVAVLVIFSATGSINGTMMTAPRVYYAMARDKLFFNWLDYIHTRFRTPSRAIIIHVIWAIVILLVRQNFENIVAGMTFAILLFYTMTTLALFKFRKMGLGGKNVYKMPFYPVLPIIYLIGLLVLIGIRSYYEWEKSLVDVAFILVGLPFAWYFVIYKQRNN